MNRLKKNLIAYLFYTMTLLQSTHAAAAALSTEDTGLAANGLLIFLDDKESIIGAITENFLSAFIQEAGPIIVSASLIENVRTPETRLELNDHDLQVLQQRDRIFNDIPELSNIPELSPEEESMHKNLLLSIIDFDTQIKNKWIIKEVNPNLYLLLPQKYMQDKKITLQNAAAFLPQGQLSQTELALGLKVNHMKPVEIAAVQKQVSAQESDYADYFISSLNDIFVAQKEYIGKESMIPSWSIYINGHGALGYSVCHLSPEQFKEFLSFLEKIQTKVLIYSSCYAAGTNENLIYKDSVSGIDQTHNFTIVAIALTDTPTYAAHVMINWEKNPLTVESIADFNCLLKNITALESTNYHEAIKCLAGDFERLENTAQIRYPGLSWFSILDTEFTIPIGSVMAKARTSPLNVATFFTKQGKPAAPEGILLYAHNVPFELIVDTTEPEEFDAKTQTMMPEECFVPTFVSMIPGDAVHHLKKVSSSCNPTDRILNNFYIAGLHTHKIFIIDEVSAPLSETTSDVLTNGAATSDAITTLKDVVIDVTETTTSKYFTYNGQVYYAEGNDENDPAMLADAEQKQKYEALLQSYGKHNVEKTTREQMDELEQNALQTFAESVMNSTQAEKAVIELLEKMPDNTALRIPSILGADCPTDNAICWFDFLTNVAKHRQINKHKLLWFDNISQGSFKLYNDIIIEITPKETHLFSKNWDGEDPQSISTSVYTDYADLTEDYVPEFAQKFAYFDEHLTLDEASKTTAADIEKKSVHEQITPETIAKLKIALGEKTQTNELKKRQAASSSQETATRPVQASKFKPLSNLELFELNNRLMFHEKELLEQIRSDENLRSRLQHTPGSAAKMILVREARKR